MIALDVGTRTLAAAEVEDGIIRRLAVREHAGTPMRGGQVQDLAAVAAGVRALRQELDLPEGTPASMAIAGGLLRTEALHVTIAGPGPWTDEDLRAAELDAVSGARALRRERGDRNGRGENGGRSESGVNAMSGVSGDELLMDLARYGVMRDGEPVHALTGMAGRSGSWTALTSWLPLEQVRLKMEAVTAGGFFPRTITVEPLAVSAALFGTTPPPSTYAVIDIGAGTSDIAVFSPVGLVEAASVPLAGDTITSAIASALSLDHLAADRLKRDPGSPVRDFWGEEKRFKAAALMDAAELGVAALVAGITDRLRALSPVLPKGLILVGGGSLWADLPERLAASLGLPPDHVRRRGAETVPGVRDETGRVRGPAFLTLLGIILTEGSSFSRRRFRRNGQPHWTLARGLRLPGELGDLGSEFTVADAMASQGDDPLLWFGEPGEATLVGSEVTGGSPGEPPVVTVNGRPASLDTSLADDDDFSIVRGASGSPSDPRTSTPIVAVVSPVIASPDASATSTFPRTPSPATSTEPVSATSPALAPATSPSSAPGPTSIASLVASLVVTLDGKAVRLELENPDDQAAVLKALKTHMDSRGFVTLNGCRVYIGERTQILQTEPGVYVSRSLDPPTVGTLVSLPVPRTLELIVDGTPSVIRDATRTALVDGRRCPAATTVAWDSAVSTERGPWRLFEALAAHHGPAASAHLNDQTAPWTAEVRAGDRVEFR